MFEPPSFLVVEDNEGLNYLIQKALQRAGFKTVGVQKGSEAIDRIRKNPNYILLLDYKLPDMNGTVLLEYLEGMGIKVPFVILTGQGDEKVAVEMMKLGARDYLIKSTNFLEILPQAAHRLIDKLSSEEELKNAVQEKEKSEQRYRLLLESMSDGVFVLSPDWRVLIANSAASDFFNLPIDKLLKSSIKNLLPSGSGDKCLSELDEALKTHQSTSVICKFDFGKGQDEYFEIKIYPVPEGLLCISTKISGRVEMENDLIKSKEQLADAQRIAHLGNWEWNLNSKHIECSDEMLDIFGLEISDRPILYSKIWRLIHRDDRSLLRETFAGSFSKKEPFNIELRILRKKREIRYIHSQAEPLFQNSNTITGFFGVCVDYTRRKLLEEQLRQANKMEAIGRLAGGVAHDFNNLLTVIRGNLELAMVGLNENDALAQDLNEIGEASQRATDLTRQLLVFSRKQKLQPKTIDLNNMLANMSKLINPLIDKNINISIDAQSDLWKVCADPGQIEQVIVNMTVNAHDAMQDDGKLTYETRNVTLDKIFTESHSGTTTGQFVQLSIIDTGSGMTDEVKTQIFDPFYTTKPAEKGTGLGLSSAFGIIKQSAGFITVETKLGNGSIFNIYLPKTSGETEEAEAEQGLTDAPVGRETILVVEDEDPVRALTVRALRRLGYNVVEAQNSGEAFLICESRSQPFDLIVSDIVMPRMNGLDFVARIRKIWPDVKALFMSGYVNLGNDDKRELASDIPFIQKPFNLTNLAHMVRDTLDS